MDLHPNMCMCSGICDYQLIAEGSGKLASVSEPQAKCDIAMLRPSFPFHRFPLVAPVLLLLPLAVLLPEVLPLPRRRRRRLRRRCVLAR